MACCSSSILLPLQPPSSKLSSNNTPHITKNSHYIPTTTSYLNKPIKKLKSFAKTRISFALTQSESDSSKSIQPDPQTLLKEIADCFKLPADYFSLLPRDLRLDLNDAAFDLSNGAVKDECGQELGEILLNVSRAWETADVSTSSALLNEVPTLVSSLTNYNMAALGRRLLSAGRRFQSMGQYGQGELQMIAKVMINTGKILSANQISQSEEPVNNTKMFKFGELQVELTPQKAYIGAAIGFIFGLLSWELSKGIQSIPESSLQYANDNAVLLGKSLRGALLAMSYSSTFLSAFATVGLVIYGRQLQSDEK